jgi:hypothetical protein
MRRGASRLILQSCQSYWAAIRLGERWDVQREVGPVTLPRVSILEDEIENGGEPAGPKGPGIKPARRPADALV